MQRILIGLALAGFATLAVAQQPASEVYQWKDASGTTHYAQTPPPKGAFQVRKITHAGGATPAGATAAATTTAAAPAPSADREKSQPCITARANVAALSGRGPVQQDTNGDGKPDAVLAESERASQLNLAQAAVQAYCTP